MSCHKIRRLFLLVIFFMGVNSGHPSLARADGTEEATPSAQPTTGSFQETWPVLALGTALMLSGTLFLTAKE